MRSDQRRSRRWRWPLVLLAAGVVALALAAAPAVIPTTVVPPADLADPVTIFLLDHGDTASLVIPGADGELVRYAYGEWNWYALGNHGFVSAVRALFWPTTGALGRKQLGPGSGEETVRRSVQREIKNLYALRVSRERAWSLAARLDESFRSAAETAVVSAGTDLTFVHYPHRYTYFHNSNHAAADWLRELGCEVKGPAFGSRWRVTP